MWLNGFSQKSQYITNKEGCKLIIRASKLKICHPACKDEVWMQMKAQTKL